MSITSHRYYFFPPKITEIYLNQISRTQCITIIIVTTFTPGGWNLHILRPNISSFCFINIFSYSLLTFWRTSESPLPWVSLWSTINIWWMLMPSAIKRKSRHPHKHTVVCPYPPYSSDLLLCNFWVSHKVRMTIQEKDFEYIQEIRFPLTVALKTQNKRLLELLERLERMMK